MDKNIKSKTFQADLIKTFNEAIALTNKLLRYNNCRSYYNQIISISQIPTYEYHYTHTLEKKCNELEVVNLLYVSHYVALLKKYHNCNCSNQKLINKRIAIPTCVKKHAFFNESNLFNYQIKLKHRSAISFDNVLFITYNCTPFVHYINNIGHHLGEQGIIIGSKLKWYATNCNYKNLDLKNITQEELDCNCNCKCLIDESQISLNKYIPIPEENFFNDYLDTEAAQNIVTINDLENDGLLIDNTTPNKQKELQIIRELYEKLLELKRVFVFTDLNCKINNLLDDVKKKEFELNTTNNLDELSQIFTYNQQNRFNCRPFIHGVQPSDTINKDAIIDIRMFNVENWNLNYYSIINTKFINSAHIQQHNYNLQRGIFWCKLSTYESSYLTILDNCKDLYFYYYMHDGIPKLYYRNYLQNKIYFANDNFIYVKHKYNDTETLILHVRNNIFTKFID